MLGHGHELHVREAHLPHVIDERLRDLAVAEHAPVLGAPPRAQVHLVDRDRRVEGEPVRAPGHPRRIVPFVFQRPHARRGARRALEEEGHRVGLVQNGTALPAPDPELVGLAALDARHRAVPDAGVIGSRRERIARLVPAVEFADHRDGGSIGRPDGKRCTVGMQVAAERLVQTSVRAFAKEIRPLVRQHLLFLRRTDSERRRSVPASSPHSRPRRLFSASRIRGEVADFVPAACGVETARVRASAGRLRLGAKAGRLRSAPPCRAGGYPAQPYRAAQVKGGTMKGLRHPPRSPLLAALAPTPSHRPTRPSAHCPKPCLARAERFRP